MYYYVTFLSHFSSSLLYFTNFLVSFRSPWGRPLHFVQQRHKWKVVLSQRQYLQGEAFFSCTQASKFLTIFFFFHYRKLRKKQLISQRHTCYSTKEKAYRFLTICLVSILKYLWMPKKLKTSLIWNSRSIAVSCEQQRTYKKKQPAIDHL